MKSIPSIPINIKRILLSLLASLCLVSKINAYIINIQILRHENSGKVVCLLGDCHGEGNDYATKEQRLHDIKFNLAQRDFFIKALEEIARNTPSQISLLFEGSMFYSLSGHVPEARRKLIERVPSDSIDILKGHIVIALHREWMTEIEISTKTDSTKPSTWIFFDLVEAYNNFPQSIKEKILLKSADPRFLLTLSQREGKAITFIQKVMTDLQIKDAWKLFLGMQDLPVIEEQILSKRNEVSPELKEALSDMRIENIRVLQQPIIQEAIQKFSSITDILCFKDQLPNGYCLFANLLDQIAVLHLAKTSAPRVSGYAHTTNVSSILQKQLGYKLVKNYGYDLDEVRSMHMFTDKHLLEEKMDAIFWFMERTVLQLQ
ncbi:MAG: hypothetical protein A2007_02935 [Verrucomicrobia bacterium GWC2_42_7]|nr:MAG: hypothetical protein A2007_02935 [Verrucomicrobia bacterium GWC2_42_7]